MRRQTREVAIARGIYHSACKCRAEIRIRAAERFPECPVCKRAVDWVFARSTLEDLPPIAGSEQAPPK